MVVKKFCTRHAQFSFCAHIADAKYLCLVHKMWEISERQTRRHTFMNIVPGGYCTASFYKNCALVNALS